MSTEQVTNVALSLIWALFAAGLTWYITRAALRITYVTLADGRRKIRRLPFWIRTLLPLTPTFAGFFKSARFAGIRTRTNARLTSAGLNDLMAAEEYCAIRLLAPLVLGSLLVLTLLGLSSAAAGAQAGMRVRTLALAGFLWTVVAPGWWLKRAVAERHRQIIRALPFVMDLLTLAVEAGLDFMTAIKYVNERRKPDAIGEELGRVLFEIQLGKTRRNALRTLAERINHSDVHSLVAALTQADEMGVSLGATLRIQADHIRSKRFQRAERLANEAPVKLLFPLLACIFPCVFLILLAPMLLQILQQGF